VPIAAIGCDAATPDVAATGMVNATTGDCHAKDPTQRSPMVCAAVVVVDVPGYAFRFVEAARRRPVALTAPTPENSTEIAAAAVYETVLSMLILVTVPPTVTIPPRSTVDTALLTAELDMVGYELPRSSAAEYVIVPVAR
jgi:hypothetical protein